MPIIYPRMWLKSALMHLKSEFSKNMKCDHWLNLKCKISTTLGVVIWDSSIATASVKVKVIKMIIFQTFKQLWTLCLTRIAAHSNTLARTHKNRQMGWIGMNEEYEDSKIEVETKEFTSKQLERLKRREVTDLSVGLAREIKKPPMKRTLLRSHCDVSNAEPKRKRRFSLLPSKETKDSSKTFCPRR